MMASGPLRVLLIEDNPTDALLLRESLAAHQPCEFTVFANGGQVCDFLQGRGQFAETGLPDLVVLDLHVPGKDGFEVLNFIRGSVELRDLVVAVVSTWPADFVAKKAAQADCHVQKPSDLDEFLALGRTILDCYLRRRPITPPVQAA